MKRPEHSEGGPARNETASNAATSTHTNNTSIVPLNADIDALAESLRGVYVCQVVVDDAGHRRTHFYRNLGAVERAVERARGRGRTAHVSLVQLVPVGVVMGAPR